MFKHEILNIMCLLVLGGNIKEYYCYGNAKKLISLPASHYEVKWKILPIFFLSEFQSRHKTLLQL